ncbi:MAG: hypothetical protein K6E73_01440 [Bacteroidales bacterium]|nr:hypothetical protein [Bacteroidales bacterium]
MSGIINKYEPGSCVFQAGSSQNGDVNMSNCTINQGIKPNGHGAGAAGASAGVGSPLHLSGRKGTKIDFIRVMNAWYECGKVECDNGARPTKQEFFEWVGRVFNIDLSDYDKDLSNSMSSSVSDEKQTRIFDELKARHQAIYDSK